MEWRNYLTAAHGYLDLGMGQEAWDELDSMPAEDRARVEVVVMRLVILQSMARWDKGAEIARGAVRYYPDCPDLYILGSYAIRRSEDVRAALDFLLGGGECMAEIGTYWFNVGCKIATGFKPPRRWSGRSRCEVEQNPGSTGTGAMRLSAGAGRSGLDGVQHRSLRAFGCSCASTTA